MEKPEVCYYDFAVKRVPIISERVRRPPLAVPFSTRGWPLFLCHMKTKALESRAQAYKRITNGILQFINHSVGTAKLIHEAKRLQIWKEKWSSWQEYCEKEFGQSRQRAYQLLDVASTIEEIQSVKPFDTESGKNKEILHDLTSRQAVELKGLAPEEKARVLTDAIKAEGGKTPKPSTIATVRAAAQLPARRSVFDGDVDPADRMPKSTKADVVVALELSTVYPKVLSFEVINSEEEVRYNTVIQAILVKRGVKKNPEKFDMHDAVRQVCNAYKRCTGKTMSVKALDAGQLRRLLESGIELSEFIEVGEKAWKATSFLAKYSHQIAMFVKHYGNIRNELDAPKNGSTQNKQIKETIHVRSL